jgi:hypothetical protein
MYSRLVVCLLQLQTVKEHTALQLSDGASDEIVEYGIAIITTPKKVMIQASIICKQYRR